jgi:ribulose-phosphate 3-epimerase
MSAIIPAILPSSRQDLEDKLLRLQGLTDRVQVDVVDGVFAGPPAWPYTAHESTGITAALEFIGTLHLEADLMVEDAETAMGSWIEAGANRIVLHVERAHALPKLLDEIQTRYGHDPEFMPGLLSVGLAIHAATDISALTPFLSRIDYVQFMGIADIGKQGQPFDPRVLPKIRAFRRANPKLPIQVDGGVSLSTAPALLAAGVSRLIVGSALWKARDLAAAYREFVALTTRYGTYT